MMPTDLAHEFANYLRDKNHLPGDSGALNGAAQSPASRTLQKLWESTDLSANDFADEVAGFFRVPRIGLPDLLSAQPLADRFSQRFLREMLVFPFQSADGEPALAVATQAITRQLARPGSCSAATSRSGLLRSRISKPSLTSAWATM